jgi:hypothetical protein
VSPVTIPVPNPTLDTVPEVDHKPPAVALTKVVVRPWHITAGPVMGAGAGLRVIGAVLKQPVGNVHVIVQVIAAAGLISVPPVTTPENEFIAISELLLLQVPPVGVPAKVVVDPEQTEVVPIMAVGGGLTVTVTSAGQPASI